MRPLIIGGTGSLGKSLIKRLAPRSERLVIYSRDEAKHWTIRNELLPTLSRYVVQPEFVVGDIRDQRRLHETIRDYQPDTIIIAAALKQVDTCERSPFESVQTNLLGTQNVINAVEYDNSPVKSVLFVSTDKACSPVNVYGMSKSVSERLVTSRVASNTKIRYLATRYGNVLESRGSIVPLFKYQGMYNAELTVTNPHMTRFIMTLDQSVDLIMYALEHGKAGETWIPRLPSMNIGDLANIFGEYYDRPVRIIGERPGEKLHEELVNASEWKRILDKHDDNHYVLAHALVHSSLRPPSRDEYSFNSNQVLLTKQDLKKYLEKLGIIDAALESFVGLNIEEIRKQ